MSAAMTGDAGFLFLGMLAGIVLTILSFVALLRVARGVERTHETLTRCVRDLHREVKRIADDLGRRDGQGPSA